EVNEAFVRAIQLSGGRVVLVGEAVAGRDAQITIRSRGQVTQVGGKDYGFDPIVQGARQRIDQMERAVEVLETLPDYRSSTRERTEIISGLRTEIDRLRGALEARNQIGLTTVGPRARSQDDVKPQVTANTREI